MRQTHFEKVAHFGLKIENKDVFGELWSWGIVPCINWLIPWNNFWSFDSWPSHLPNSRQVVHILNLLLTDWFELSTIILLTSPRIKPFTSANNTCLCERGLCRLALLSPVTFQCGVCAACLSGISWQMSEGINVLVLKGAGRGRAMTGWESGWGESLACRGC